MEPKTLNVPMVSNEPVVFSVSALSVSNHRMANSGKMPPDLM
jgi:hypothetical protein